MKLCGLLTNCFKPKDRGIVENRNDSGIGAIARSGSLAAASQSLISAPTRRTEDPAEEVAPSMLLPSVINGLETARPDAILNLVKGIISEDVTDFDITSLRTLFKHVKTPEIQTKFNEDSELEGQLSEYVQKQAIALQKQASSLPQKDIIHEAKEAITQLLIDEKGELPAEIYDMFYTEEGMNELTKVSTDAAEKLRRSSSLFTSASPRDANPGNPFEDAALAGGARLPDFTAVRRGKHSSFGIFPNRS